MEKCLAWIDLRNAPLLAGTQLKFRDGQDEYKLEATVVVLADTQVDTEPPFAYGLMILVEIVAIHFCGLERKKEVGDRILAAFPNLFLDRA